MTKIMHTIFKQSNVFKHQMPQLFVFTSTIKFSSSSESLKYSILAASALSSSLRSAISNSSHSKAFYFCYFESKSTSSASILTAQEL